MPILSAVLTLPTPEPALEQLQRRPEITIGPSAGSRVPVVLTTDTRAEDKALWDWIQSLPGLHHVELVFADFSDLHNEEGS